MSRLSLDAIRMVQAISSTGSFSTAGIMLHKTPSAISYRVAAIEDRLGVKLFNRNGPIITLTREGDMLLNEGEWIINAVDCLEKRITTVGPGEQDIRIGTNGVFPVSLLNQDIAEFLNKKKNAKLDVKNFPDGEEWIALENNNVDLIITSSPHPPHIEAQSKVLFNTDIICSIGQQHKFSSRHEPVTKLDLKSDIQITQEDGLNRGTCRSGVFEPDQKTLIVSDLASIINLTKSGIGHAFLPYISVAEEINKGQLIVVNTEMMTGEETFCLAWHPRRKSRSIDWWIQRILNIKFACSRHPGKSQLLSA